MPTYVDLETGELCSGTPGRALRWFELPYGMWSGESGREVLFNRRYCPIWSRPSADGVWERASRSEWVTERKEERFFYGSAETTEAEKHAKAKEALAARGLPIPTHGQLVSKRHVKADAVRIAAERHRSIRDATRIGAVA